MAESKAPKVQKITCNTKPIVDALDLGIISANISKHYRLSTMIQITGTKNLVTFNTAAANILSEMKVRGMSEGISSNEPVIALIDADKFKSLMSTIEANTVEIEFVEGGIILRAGSSKFVFPAYVDSSDYTLPGLDLADKDAPSIDINVANWKAIQNNQSYALAASFVHPVYNNLYIGGDGTALAGDFDISAFTLSQKGEDILERCLLPGTIINLLASVPDGAKIVKTDNGYQIQVRTDTFEYTSQFVPKHEEDEDVGSYHADIILSQFQADTNIIDVSLPALRRSISQIDIVSDIESNSKVDLQVRSDILTVSTGEVNVPIKVKPSAGSQDWDAVFYFKQLQKAVAHHNEDTLHLSPIIHDDSVDGLLMYDVELQTIIATVQD